MNNSWVETVKEDSSSELCDVTLKKEKEYVLNWIEYIFFSLQGSCPRYTLRSTV